MTSKDAGNVRWHTENVYKKKLISPLEIPELVCARVCVWERESVRVAIETFKLNWLM